MLTATSVTWVVAESGASHTASARWMLGRAPSLVGRRFEPFGGTLLHLAVEWDRPDFARLALENGTDPQARDRTYRGTPLDWVGHTGAAATGAALEKYRYDTPS